MSQAFPFDFISAMQNNGLVEKMSFYFSWSFEKSKFFGQINYYFVDSLKKTNINFDKKYPSFTSY